MSVFATVLIIEDDLISINIYERLLTFTNFTNNFIAKRDGQQAKEFLMANKSSLPDIIFVDLYMAGMNGCEFLDWFEKWCARENINVPIYVLSSSMSKYDFDMAHARKIDGYIVKPITTDHLKEITEKHHIKAHTALNIS